PMSGARRPLRALPAGALRSVLQQNPALLQLVANAIRSGEVAPEARLPACLDEPFDLLDGNWRLSVLLPAQRDDAEHAIEMLEGVADDRRVRGAHLPRVDGGVERAHEVEHGRQAGGGVEIVAERRIEL